jgi:phosphotransferase system  glucose/maltose/N-acetylglucosamine-specific IIC component
VIVSVVIPRIIGFHWFILDLVDLIQSVVTCFTAYYIIKYLNEKEMEIEQEKEVESLPQTKEEEVDSIDNKQ